MLNRKKRRAGCRATRGSNFISRRNLEMLVYSGGIKNSLWAPLDESGG
jgi:hypothetical protein